MLFSIDRRFQPVHSQRINIGDIQMTDAIHILYWQGNDWDARQCPSDDLDLIFDDIFEADEHGLSAHRVIRIDGDGVMRDETDDINEKAVSKWLDDGVEIDRIPERFHRTDAYESAVEQRDEEDRYGTPEEQAARDYRANQI